MKSIIQSNKECYVCKKTYGLELHHCIFGRNRHNSDEDGLVVWLCSEDHRGTYGVHGKYGKELDTKLKVLSEIKWCKYYNKTPEDFRKRYYCNYL